MDSNDQTVHVYNADKEKFKSSTEFVLNAIATQTPLVAICGDEWLPTSTDMLTGDPCPACFEISPGAFKKSEPATTDGGA